MKKPVKPEMRNMKTIQTTGIIKGIIFIILLISMTFLIGGKADALGLDRLEIPERPETEAWYRITPEGAVSADGSPWHGMFKKGQKKTKSSSGFTGAA